MKGPLSLLSAAVLFVLAGTNADAAPSVTRESSPASAPPPRPASQHRAVPTGSTVLYDQTSGMPGAVVPVDNFTAFYANYSSQGADDFIVPTGESWAIDGFVIPFGQPGNASGVPAAADVLVLADDGSGHPTGAVVCDRTGTPGTAAGGNFTLTLAIPCELTEGSYWLELAFANVTFGTVAGWAVRAPIAGQAAQWQNPGGTYGTPCDTWEDFATCFVSAPSSQIGGDYAFQILGAVISRPDEIFFGGFDPAM